MQARSILVLLTAGALCACEPPETISGMAAVVDGDSLKIEGTSIRLYAIDAPEGRQTCLRDDVVWHCGETAAAKLRAMADGRIIVCTQKDTDIYGRTVAVCSNGTEDLGAEMVLAGLALAYRQYGRDYVAEESEARAARRGLWASEFTAPWDWRRNPRRPVPRSGSVEDAAPKATGDCLIKGNINRRNEHIYHVPGSRSYDETRIDTTRGERWFCSETEARAAGWRAPRG